MKKALKITLSTIGIVVAVVVVAIVLFFVWASKQPAVKDSYFDSVQTKAELASLGFIVVGNEDDSSWNVKSSAVSLDFILSENEKSDSIFFQKIDTENIGIAGHSQGGVGTINAVTNQVNGNKYKAMYTASATHTDLATGLKWSYDLSDINIPYFMVAGTKNMDAGDNTKGSEKVGIAPLFSLQENYAAVSDTVPKIMARRKNADHGDMLATADAYMTAWFMYWLKNDPTAKEVFFGDNAEILNNGNWQDVNKNL